jgi:ribosome-associated protein
MSQSERKPTPRKTRKKRVPAPRRSKVPAMLKLGVAAADDKQAIDLVVLDLRKATAFTDFFVICTGTNVRQNQAIADAIQERLGEHGHRPALVEGYARGEWILIDYFDFLFHIFTPATREYFDLERLWGDGVKIAVSA